MPAQREFGTNNVTGTRGPAWAIGGFSGIFYVVTLPPKMPPISPPPVAPTRNRMLLGGSDQRLNLVKCRSRREDDVPRDGIEFSPGRRS